MKLTIKQTIYSFALSATLLISSFNNTFTQPILDDNRLPAETLEQLMLFSEVFAQIKSRYVEDISDEELIKAAIEGMVGLLDKHSTYFDHNQLEKFIQDQQHSVTGIGAQLTTDSKTGFVKIDTVFKNSPAEINGIKEGDLITHVDGIDITTMELIETVDLITGEPDTTVTLTIKRGDNIHKIDIVRKIYVAPLTTSRLLDNKIAYIQLSQFGENASLEIENAYRELKDQTNGNIVGLILDLRFNPGGLLNEAANICDLFLNGGTIVTTRDRMGNGLQNYTALPGTMIPESMPLVILVNDLSASASEIVAGTLQDLNRATIIGTTTYGKGSVQTVFPLSGNNAIKLTTAKYYTASGRSIHEIGVTPDIIVELPEDAEFNPKSIIDDQMKAAISHIL